MNIEELNRTAKILIDETWKDSSKWHSNFNQAKELLERALVIAPKDETSLINYGTVLCDMGAHKEAAECFKKVIAQGSENKHAFLNLGIALINCSTHENAMVYITQAKSKTAGAETWEAYFDPMGH